MACSVGHLNPVGSALLAAGERSSNCALACSRKNQRRFTGTGGPVDVVTRVGAVSLDGTAARGRRRLIRRSWPGDGGHYGGAVLEAAATGRAGTANVGAKRALMPRAAYRLNTNAATPVPQHQCRYRLNANTSTLMPQVWRLACSFSRSPSPDNQAVLSGIAGVHDFTSSGAARRFLLPRRCAFSRSITSCSLPAPISSCTSLRAKCTIS
jgi:hypothetical protein